MYKINHIHAKHCIDDGLFDSNVAYAIMVLVTCGEHIAMTIAVVYRYEWADWSDR